MRPSLRQVSKPFEFLVPAATRNRAYFGAPICMQCRIRAQKRCFTNDPKRPDSPKSAIASSATSSHSVDKSSKIEDVVRDLPSTQESRRSLIGKRFSHLMDNMQGNIFIASQRLNDLTGYSGIEALKERITQLESRVQDAQESVRSSRLAYKTTVADRASTQKEVTGLLARKDTWSPDDLERFTKLYRMDHSNEQAVQEAATRLADAEREAEHAASRLSSSILSRYHEEQIWSDKIRRMSTWGTWGLMGVNVLLFLVFQFGFEPWRRSRLVRGFEEKVLEALEREGLNHATKNDTGKQPLGGTVKSATSNAGENVTDRASTNPAGTAAPEMVSKGQDSLKGTELQVPMAALQPRKPLDTWTAAVKDLFSKRTISVQKQDMTVAALEGAATGATLAAIIATLIFRHSS